MLVGVVSLIAIVGGTVLAISRSQAKKSGERSDHDQLLAAASTVLTGSTLTKGVLTGTYAGRRVDVEIHRIDPTPRVAYDTKPQSIPVVTVHVTAGGAHNWFLRSTRESVLSSTPVYEFVREAAPEAFRRFSPLGDLIPTSDPEVEARLAAAGLVQTLERVEPAGNLWLPRCHFVADPRAAIAARMGRLPGPMPSGDTGPGSADARVGLTLDLPQHGPDDPDPARFRAILDGLVAMAEINERVDPPAPVA